MRPGPRALLGIVVLVIGLNLVVQGVTVITGGTGPAGPTSSSYATADDGLAAYAELLVRHGHPVERLRVRLDRARLDPGSTLVLADPDGIGEAEARAVADFVGAGGRLLAAGSSTAPLLGSVLGLDWDGGRVSPARPLVPVPEVAGVATVEAVGAGRWSDAGATLPVLGTGDRVLATVAAVGPGRVLALADASPLQNRQLDRADNAAFALAAAGEPGRPVAFAEAQHGYGRGTGLGAIPARWRWAVGGGFLAAVIWMWARGRRLGPPDEVERIGPPPRRAYVEAMAAALARTRQPEVVAAELKERARRRVASRAALPVDAPEDELRQAALAVGLTPAEADAVFGERGDLVAAGRALARLGERRP